MSDTVSDKLREGTIKVMDFLPILQMASQTASVRINRNTLYVREDGTLVTMDDLAERLRQYEEKHK